MGENEWQHTAFGKEVGGRVEDQVVLVDHGGEDEVAFLDQPEINIFSFGQFTVFL